MAATMMDVTLSHAAEIALGSLGEKDRRRVHAWCDHLKNLENDPHMKSRSRRLDVPGHQNIYVLRTSTDLRLFYVKHADRIEVIDIARRDSLQTIAEAS